MDCKNCSEELTAYLDGELERARFREVEGHLEGCLPCLEELESLKQSSRLVERHLQELEPRPEMWNKLAASIAASQSGTPSKGVLYLFSGRPWLTAFAGLAAAVILGVSLWGLWNLRQSEHLLQQYMSSYVQQRDLTEQTVHAAPPHTQPEFRTADAQHLEYTDNPFVEISDEEFQNPFHSEAQ
jgi:hypothetical protein